MKPYAFDEFFSSGLEESVSPFLTRPSRSWGRNLSLKTSASAAVLLGAAFFLSPFSPPSSYLLLSFVYFLAGTPALIAAIDDIKNLEINIDVLMTLAAFIAVVLGSGLEGALLLVLFELSHAMEESVSKKALSALHNLNTLAPKFAHIIDSEGRQYEKAVREIEIGETLLIKQGEIVPLDGVVIEGHSSLNLVHLTGESLPVPKTKGDTVAAGARNLEAALTIQVTRISADSTLARIIRLIREAKEAKPRLQRVLDRFGKHYASTVIGLTFFFALALPFLFPISYFGTEGAIYRALAFLIAASPCALIIATPTAYLSAMSACARKGILLKGGITLDALQSCSTIAFDKTGTLTTGHLECTRMEAIGNVKTPLDAALSIAYGLERQVVHPIAHSICLLAKEKGCAPAEISSFKATPGFGLEGKVGNISVAIGLPEHIAAKLRFRSPHALPIEKTDGEVLALLLVGEDLFCFRFRDRMRHETSQLIETLRRECALTPIMLTGDHAKNAQSVGRFVGIEAVFADLRPEDKLKKVAELAEKGGLAMVGDGINDAPALARATVGISMGQIGSATAVDASDVVLLNDELFLIPWLFAKAKKTRRIVLQNLTLALSVICLATLPALFGLVPLWTAVLLHEGGTVLVGLNSLRLLKK